MASRGGQQQGPQLPDAGHSFSKKTFHKPTYCHHCADMLWGLLQQGYICEGQSSPLKPPSTPKVQSAPDVYTLSYQMRATQMSSNVHLLLERLNPALHKHRPDKNKTTTNKYYRNRYNTNENKIVLSLTLNNHPSKTLKLYKTAEHSYKYLPGKMHIFISVKVAIYVICSVCECECMYIAPLFLSLSPSPAIFLSRSLLL